MISMSQEISPRRYLTPGTQRKPSSAERRPAPESKSPCDVPPSSPQSTPFGHGIPTIIVRSPSSPSTDHSTNAARFWRVDRQPISLYSGRIPGGMSSQSTTIVTPALKPDNRVPTITALIRPSGVSGRILAHPIVPLQAPAPPGDRDMGAYASSDRAASTVSLRAERRIGRFRPANDHVWRPTPGVRNRPKPCGGWWLRHDRSGGTRRERTPGGRDGRASYSVG